MFKKYARAIKDDRLRQKMRKMYISKIVWFALSFVIFCSLIIIGAANSSEEEAPVGTTIAIVMLCLVALACIILGFVSWAKFGRKFKAILRDEPLNEELELDRAIKKYREAYSLFMADIKKTTTFASITMILAMVICVALIVASANMYEVNSELSDILMGMGFLILIIGIICAVIPSFIYGFKKGNSNKWWQTEIADEIRLIDKYLCRAEGKEYVPAKQKYDVLLDKNAQTLNYLMPTEELRTLAMERRKKSSVFTCSIFLILMIFCAVILIVFRDSEMTFIFPLTIFGYPIFVVALSILTNWPIKKLEKRQHEILKSEEKYALNLKLFEGNIAFSKKWDFWFQLVFGICGGLIIGLILALLLPNTGWWLLSLGWLIVVLLIRNKQFGKLRLSAKVIEDEIDRLNPKEEEPSELPEKAQDDELINLKNFIKRFEFDYATDEQRKHYFVYALYSAIAGNYGLVKYFRRMKEISLKSSEFVLEVIKSECNMPAQVVSLLESAVNAYRNGADFNYLDTETMLFFYSKELAEICQEYAKLY